MIFARLASFFLWSKQYVGAGLVAVLLTLCDSQARGESPLLDVWKAVESELNDGRRGSAHDRSSYDSDSQLVKESDMPTAYNYLRSRANVRQEMSDHYAKDPKDLLLKLQYAKEAFECWKDLFKWLGRQSAPNLRDFLPRTRQELKNLQERKTYLDSIRIAAGYVGSTMWSAVCVDTNRRHSCPDWAPKDGNAAWQVYESMDSAWLIPTAMAEYLRLFAYERDADFVLAMRGRALKDAIGNTDTTQRAWGELAWRLRELANHDDFGRMKIRYNDLAAAIEAAIPADIRNGVKHGHEPSSLPASSPGR
jgi:hypothetical protein